MRLWIAIKIFFVALFDAEVAQQAGELLERRKLPKEEETPPPETPKEELRKTVVRKAPVRSEAVTLLSALQREARFVDFIREPLEGYSNEQIGAAARDVHRECGRVIDRLFGVEPLLNLEEGADVAVPVGFDAGRYRLVGNVAGEPPFRGKLVHHGWVAAKVELPEWSGSEEAATVVAPVEVELK